MNSFWILVASALVAAESLGERSGRHTVNFLHYYNLDEIKDFLQDVADDSPNLVSLENIGTTYESRPITAVRISLKSNVTQKPMIMVESGLHAREWIAPMVNLYLVHMFAEHTSVYEDLLRKVDLLFIVMANPDGFDYSLKTDRSWNKNRKPNVGSRCFGVDLNRNFDFKFISSNDPCNENYPGPSAASEVETQAVQNLITKYQSKIQVYLSLQAFGQQILTPFNYNRLWQYAFDKNTNRSLKLASLVANKISSVNGRRYQIGRGALLLKTPEAGTSSDYAYGAKSIPMAYTMKLPGGRNSVFEVPESELNAILTESFEGFLQIVKFVSNAGK